VVKSERRRVPIAKKVRRVRIGRAPPSQKRRTNNTR